MTAPRSRLLRAVARLVRRLRPPIHSRRIERCGVWTIATAASRKSGGYVAWAKVAT